MSVPIDLEVYCDLGDYGLINWSSIRLTNPIPTLDPPDGDFTTDMWNLTSRVLNIHIKRGMFRPNQRVCDPSVLEIDLIDDATHSKDTPENPNGSSLKPGRVVVIFSDDGVTVRMIFGGVISLVRPDAASRQTKLICTGVWNPSARVSLPTMIDTTVADVAYAALDAAGLGGSGLNVDVGGHAKWWFIADGTETDGGLDDMFVAGDLLQPDVSGDTELAYVMDQYMNTPIGEIIRDLVHAEVGLFFENKFGQLRLASRSQTMTVSPHWTVVDTDIVGHDYTYGAGLVNDLTMQIVPRKVVSDSTIWTSGEVIVFKEGTTYLNIRTLNTDGRVVGLLDTPRPSNWNFKRVSTGAAVDCAVLITQVGAGVIAEVQNDLAGERVYLAIGAMLVGDALIKDLPMELVEQHHKSIVSYGRRSMSFGLAMLDAPDVAQDILRFFLSMWAYPAGSITHFDIRNDSVSNRLLMFAADILDCIQVTLDSVYHDGIYLIKGLEHWFDLAAQKATCRIYVERQRAGGFWFLDIPGYAELGVNTRLGY